MDYRDGANSLRDAFNEVLENPDGTRDSDSFKKGYDCALRVVNDLIDA